VRLVPELRTARFYASRGHHYSMLKDFESASADLREAIALEPQNAEYYTTFSYVLALRHDFDGTIEQLTRAYELQVSEAAALEAAVGDADAKKLVISLARQHVLDAAAKLADAYQRRATVRLINGDAAGALGDNDRAIELNPKSPHLRSSRALTLRDLERYEDAFRDCDAAIQLDQSCSEALYVRGHVYCAMKDYIKAIDTFDQAVLVFPNTALLYSGRAAVWQEIGQLEKALNDLNQAIDIEKDNPGFYSTRAELLRALHRDEDAAADTAKVQELMAQD
jgi:tetratricopeptide (TPR) repeat protein